MPLTSLSKLKIVGHPTFFILPILFLLHSSIISAQSDLPVSPNTDDALEEELKYLQAETYVITPSRIPENIKKTASSISVITDRQIRQMGARHLADVLQTVPGMNYWFDASIGTLKPTARGVVRGLGNYILIMINGLSMHENYAGGAVGSFDTIQLDNVKRIEVLRSPGSAVYGANALFGVINIITKDAEDVDGWEVIARGGSYDTQQYNLLYGKTFNDLEVAFNYNYFNTHGYDKHVNEDLQSTLDQLFLTNASLAPGRMKGDEEKYDFSLNVKYKGFTLDGRYVDREKDIPVGWNAALNEKSDYFMKDYYLNLSYEKTPWEKLDLFGKVYRTHNHTRFDAQQFPPGAAQLTPWGPVIMRNGVTEILSFKNNRTGFEIQATYRMNGSNTVLAGITYEEMKQFDVNRRANYFFTPFPIVIVPLLSIRDLTHIQNHNRSAKRNLKAFFVEDIWDITENLRLSAGIRYDDYSDFGSEVSPRVGAVWEFKKGYDLKLLYGHAFRAPSFGERYDSRYGNRDLDPEEVDTYEVSIGAELTPSLKSRVTWYHSQGDDLIFGGNIIYPQIENFGKIRFQGVEAEMKYNFGRGTYLAMNYTYQRWISPHTDYRNALVPRHTGNIMTNIRLSKHLNWYAACHIKDGFRRSVEDTRDDLSGFAIVNTTLIVKKFLKGYEGLEIRGSVYNLFDKDYSTPDEVVMLLPNDVPRPGRNFLIEMKYKF
jgi:iron complex outermembrane receptor protein